MKNKEIYEKLREKYTDEEIAESFIFPSELSPEEEEKSNKEFSEWLKKHRENKSPEERERDKKLVAEWLKQQENKSNT